MAWVDYDQLAAVYDQDRAVPLEALEPWRAALAAYLPPASGLPVLDLGAGTGLFAVAIAQWFDTAVIALEPSGGMRNQAIDLAELTSNAGGLRRVFAAGRQLGQWRNEPFVQEVHDRLLALAC
jgi:ubiquinone/menaquinone biosynthesis C-methylase UbiE